ncbi:MAG: type III pantothenate kinase [Thiobacillus sp.]
MSLRLLVDAGNSRVKWVVVDGETWSTPGQACYDDLTGFSASLRPGMCVYLACVASDAQRARLYGCLNAVRLTVHELRAGERFGALENGYAQPGQLGVDRWMALIGARARTQSPVLVVSAGTALTVDSLTASGRFLGGLIVPGRTLMRHALQAGAARVGPDRGDKRDFPVCTADAVESGIAEAMAGAVRAQRDRLARVAGCMPRCFVTGGDARDLMASLDWPAEHLPALVLEGMDWAAKKERTR